MPALPKRLPRSWEPLLRIGRPINTLDMLVCGIGLANGADGIITKGRDFKDAEKVAELNVRLI